MKRNLVGKILGKIKIFVQDFVPIRTALRPFLTRKFFQEILGLERSKNFLESFPQVHNLKILDHLLRSKKYLVGKYSRCGTHEPTERRKGLDAQIEREGRESLAWLGFVP